MKKRKRITYRNRDGAWITDLYYSFNEAYYGVIKYEDGYYYWIIVESFDNVTKCGGRSTEIKDAKSSIREGLIALKCLIGKEMKKGITVDKQGNLVVK